MKMKNSIKILTLAVVALALTAGCMLQPNVEGTGGIALSFGGVDTSAVIDRDTVNANNGQDAYVRLYLKKGNQFYNTQDQRFQANPFFVDVSLDSSGQPDPDTEDLVDGVTVDSAQITIAGLNPGSNYYVNLAVGIKDSSSSSLLQVYKYTQAGPFPVSVGSVTNVQITDDDNTVSGVDYLNTSVAGKSVVSTGSTVYVLTDNGLYQASDLTAPITLPGVTVSDITSLSATILPGNTEKELWINTSVAEGIYRYDGSTASSIGPQIDLSDIVDADALPVGIRTSAGFEYTGEDDQGEEFTAGIALYQSEKSLGFAYFDVDDTADNNGLGTDSWMDILAEAGADLPSEIKLDTVIKSFHLNSDPQFVVLATEFGTFFMNDETVDALMGLFGDDDGDGDGTDDQSVGEDSSITDIIDSLGDSLKTISGFSTKPRAILVAGDLVLFGTDQGIYSVEIETDTDGIPAPVGTTATSIAANNSSILGKRVQRLVVNDDQSKLAALYADGTIQVYTVDGTGITFDDQRPFFAGTPGTIAYDNGLRSYQSSITGLAWGAGDILYIVGPEGVVSWAPYATTN